MRRALLITAAIWLSAAPAMAQQDDGVFVDPDSPTAKEYAIPLDAARRQASGGNPSPSGGGAATPAPRFGEGVGDEQAATGASGGGNGGSTGGSASGSGNATGSGTENGSGSSTSSTGSGRPPSVAASRPGAPSGGGVGTTLMVIGGGAGLLLVGAGAGYALRRRPAPGT